jgi:hypothetical protein
MINRIHYIIPILLFAFQSIAQKSSLDFDGQLSWFGSFVPEAEYSIQSGVQYIPELTWDHQIDTARQLEFNFSLNSGIVASVDPWEANTWESNLSPYRIWLKYAAAQWELRGGLQKIDFGSATALRPLQWFNQIDPRDPLQITNGVYGLMGRYFFLNNANIWIWSLYGNQERRALDFFESYPSFPEFGGRVQLPVPRGEIALSYHYREAQVSFLTEKAYPENRIGFDGKWDVVLGLWIEASYTRGHKDLGDFTNQFFGTIGTDYTFGIGNGLNIILEHMSFSIDKEPFEFKEPGHFSAAIVSYPISFYDNLSSIIYYNWADEDLSFFVNLQHQFSSLSAYLMLFYIPESQGSIQQANFINNLSGPGIRIMLVYNH